MYSKVESNMNFVEREHKVIDFWREKHIFQKSMDSRKEGETYTFYDGPPTANGKPHIGHVLTRVIKDMIEGTFCAAKSRMGHTRSSGGAGSGKAAGVKWQRTDRSIRYGAVYQAV